MSNLGIFGDNKRRNLNIFLKCGSGVSWSCAPLVVVSTGGICAGFRTCRTCHRLALVLWWCAPCLLSALLHCACRVACKYGSISRFKGVLRGFYGADVCLYGFGVFRGLCGFCARVELGGLKACGVFASILSSFVLFLVLYFVLYLVLLLLCLPFFLPLCSCFLCLSYCPLLVLSLCLPSLCGLLAFFPFRTASDTKRRGAYCVPSYGRVLLY